MERRSPATAIIGARREVFTMPRRLLAWALERDLTAFVVPDERLVRAAGLDLEAAGLRPVQTPRHATVLLLVDPVPDALAVAVGVVYSQMPRPRAILAAGGSSLPGLPESDVVTPLDQDALQAGVTQLRRELAAGAFAPGVAEFEITAVQTRTQFVCPMHPEIVRDEPGTCPICGMDLVSHETAGTMPAPAHDHRSAPTHDDVAAPAHTEHAAAVYTCPMHPQIAEPEPDLCPICGMNLVPATTGYDGPEPQHDPESATGDGAHVPVTTPHKDPTAHRSRHTVHDMATVDPTVNQRDLNHRDSTHDAMAHATVDQRPVGHGTTHHGAPASDAQTAMNHDSDAEPAIAQAEMNHGTMDHTMPGDGFMSMVAMTRDLPRSADGLPMEWIDVPFGPLFPGLPGGLDVSLTLDGDGVARAAVATGSTARGLETTWPGPLETFPDRLARVNPLAPVAYRLLAWHALEDLAGLQIDPSATRARIRAAEWERAGSHLGWLADFGALIGEQWVSQRAAALQVAVARTADEAPASLIKEIREFAMFVARMPGIDRRLAGIGETGTLAPDRMRGPVARAAGILNDARTADTGYQALGFTPVVRAGGDALARLQVRLAEITSSLGLYVAVADSYYGTSHSVSLPSHLSGTAEATIETPQGAVWLQIVVDHGAVISVHLDPPSVPHIGLVPEITAGEEVADALVAVASLDLSPWEVDP